MSAAVILCPDRFVAELFSPRAQMEHRVIVAAHRARRHPYKQAAMCIPCIFGKHGRDCGSETCSCVCRERLTS
jgi:hypothetical protein